MEGQQQQGEQPQDNTPRFGCYIGNVDNSITLEMLQQVFAQCGEIVHTNMAGRETDPFRYGFIDFATEEARQNAFRYNGFNLAGRPLKVGISKGPTERNRGPRFGCYIGNIDNSITLDMLKQVFAQCGEVIHANLAGRETDPYRYGFIEFASEEARQNAFRYNGFNLAGRPLKVGISKGKQNNQHGGHQMHGHQMHHHHHQQQHPMMGMGMGHMGMGMGMHPQMMGGMGMQAFGFGPR